MLVTHEQFYVAVDGNRLTEVPSQIALLTKLRILHIGKNSLTAIPTEFINLVNLTIDPNYPDASVDKNMYDCNVAIQSLPQQMHAYCVQSNQKCLQDTSSISVTSNIIFVNQCVRMRLSAVLRMRAPPTAR